MVLPTKELVHMSGALVFAAANLGTSLDHVAPVGSGA